MELLRLRNLVAYKPVVLTILDVSFCVLTLVANIHVPTAIF